MIVVTVSASERAQKLIEARRFHEAIPILQSALKIAQSDTVLWGQLCACYTMLGLFDLALRAVKTGLAISANAKAYGQQTYCLLRLGKFDEALESARMQIRLSGAAYGYGLESQALLKLGHIDEAINSGIINVRLTGETVAIGQLAEILRKNREYQRAISLIEDHIPEERMNFGNRLCLAYARMNLRQFNLAFDQLQLAEKLIEKNTRLIIFNPYLRLHAGMVFLCDMMDREGFFIPDLFLESLVKAVDWLKAHRTVKFARYQCNDFRNALKIIDEHGL